MPETAAPTEDLRDPRVDPRPGDVLQKGNQTVMITRVELNNFGFTFEGSPMPVDLLIPYDKPWRPGWRKWAATATVVSRGDENVR